MVVTLLLKKKKEKEKSKQSTRRAGSRAYGSHTPNKKKIKSQYPTMLPSTLGKKYM
jgi:hypothetical protein